MADENTTKETPDARPFEERILSALTEMRAEFNARLEKIEAKTYDTKPIWERALAEIVELRQEVRAGFRDTDRQIGVLSKDVVRLRADVGDAVERLHDIERKS